MQDRRQQTSARGTILTTRYPPTCTCNTQPCYRCKETPCKCADGATLLQGDCLSVMPELPEKHFHCCVTSPPYFALRSYLPADHPDKPLEIGSEKSIEAFVATMVEVFRGVKRVLRDDGVLFLNLGDSYVSTGKNRTPEQVTRKTGLQGGLGNQIQGRKQPTKVTGELKHKDLCGIPWRVALALQADGWYLRDAIVWHKPSPMPGSQRDRCTSSYEMVFQLTKQPTYYWDMSAVKEVGKYGFTPKPGMYQRLGNDEQNPERTHLGSCPDGDGGTRIPRNVWTTEWTMEDCEALLESMLIHLNQRPEHPNIFTIASEGYKDAHFATFPRALPEKCIKAATSEKGCCPECGKPWVRLTESERVRTRPGEHSKSYDKTTGEVVDDGMEKPWRDRAEIGNRDPGRHVTSTWTVGWRPGCECGGRCSLGQRMFRHAWYTRDWQARIERRCPGPLEPCRVLDPFGGAGTTALAAIGLQRHCTLIELAEDYCDQIVKRLRDGLYATGTKRNDCKGQQTLFGDA